MTLHETMVQLRRRGWEYADVDSLTLWHVLVPDLQYLVFPSFGIFEQRRSKSGTWWTGQGWSWGRFVINSDGQFLRLRDKVLA